MFNIDRELEIKAGRDSSDRYQFVSARRIDDIIRVDYREGSYSSSSQLDFDAKTGVYIGHQEQDSGEFRLRAKSESSAVDHFYVHAGHRDWPKEAWFRLTQHDLLSGKDAADIVKEMNAKGDTPWKFMVKKDTILSPIRDYPSWYAERVETGEWIPVPWADEPWVQNHPHHFAHIAKSDSDCIAFWSSEATAVKDECTVMSPGRYLTQYFGDVLTPNEIRDWAVKIEVECELRIVDTPDEIVEAYAQSGTGCMRHAEQDHYGGMWRGGKNPTRVYGAGDLGVATLWKRDKCISRALVWPAKKVVGRIYGDIERMKDFLTLNEWKFDSTGHGMDNKGKGLFNGARLLMMPVGDDYIMPYIDYHYMVDKDEEAGCFRMNMGGGLNPRRTDGLLFGTYNEICSDDEDGGWDCARCDSSMDEDDSQYYVTGHGDWCYHCYDNYASRCDSCDETISDSDSNTTEDETFCNGCWNTHVTSCDYCSEYVRRRDLTSTHNPDEDLVADICSVCRDNPDHARLIDGILFDTDSLNSCDDADCDARFVGDTCPTCVTPEVEPA